MRTKRRVLLTVWCLLAATLGAQLALGQEQSQKPPAETQADEEIRLTRVASAPVPPPQQGGAVRGAAGGAALGAIGGAIGGNAGKGAAIGAGVGAGAGLIRQAGRNQQAAQAQQQAQAQAQAGRNNYDRAYAVCLEGRGYQVR